MEILYGTLITVVVGLSLAMLVGIFRPKDGFRTWVILFLVVELIFATLMYFKPPF